MESCFETRIFPFEDKDETIEAALAIGIINNLFNNRNATYGTFFDTGTGAQQASQIPFTSDPRTVTPLQPISFYGGVKVIF